MKFFSPDFEDGGVIPEKFSCTGAGIRPVLVWSEVPANAKSLAISVVDPDAPSGNFVHWLVVNVPPNITGIKSDESFGIELPNTAGKTEYIAPCPPSGSHRYVFTLYALDVEELGKESFKDFFSASKDNIIDQAEFTGKYQRS